MLHSRFPAHFTAKYIAAYGKSEAGIDDLFAIHYFANTYK